MTPEIIKETATNVAFLKLTTLGLKSVCVRPENILTIEDKTHHTEIEMIRGEKRIIEVTECADAIFQKLANESRMALEEYYRMENDRQLQAIENIKEYERGIPYNAH
ncbi:hypothetical protein FACS1894189_9210 [Planctomycetales bacterium]|nr:hypothetical protein FACS1894189_9210 [Planctomycetales bacterium]